MTTKTRLRKVSCPDCGYTVRMTRSWMLRGFPQCPCGGTLRPEAPADLAYCGLIGPEDMPLREWNAIARENGWDVVLNHGQATRLRGRRSEPTRHAEHAAHCAYPGCGRWVAADAEHCTAGHAQREGAAQLAAMPF